MTQLFFVPNVPTEASDFLNLLSRANIPFVNASKLFDILGKLDSEAIVVVSLPFGELAILAKYTTSLLQLPPTALFGVPNVNYPSDWGSIAALMAPIDYIEFSRLLFNKGAIGNTVKAIEKKGQGINTSPHVSDNQVFINENPDESSEEEGSYQ